MSWIDEVKDRPVAKQFVEIAGKERIARAEDEAARRALARVLVNHARKAGLDLHGDAESLTEKLAIYAEQERFELMIEDMDKMTDVRQFPARPQCRPAWLDHLIRSRRIESLFASLRKASSTARGITNAEAGRIMGLPQPKVSELCHGKTADYIERLYRLLNLGVQIEVVMRDLPDWSTGDVVIHNAQEQDSEREPAMSMSMGM